MEQNCIILRKRSLLARERELPRCVDRFVRSVGRKVLARADKGFDHYSARVPELITRFGDLQELERRLRAELSPYNLPDDNIFVSADTVLVTW